LILNGRASHWDFTSHTKLEGKKTSLRSLEEEAHLPKNGRKCSRWHGEVDRESVRQKGGGRESIKNNKRFGSGCQEMRSRREN